MTDKILALNDLLLECAAGVYQWALLSGQECWSGSSLRGEARRWSGAYSCSRGHLLTRIQEALRPRGRRATLGYVLMGEPRRWHLRLILISPEMRRYDQVTGLPAEIVELPEGSAVRPGFELREVA